MIVEDKCQNQSVPFLSEGNVKMADKSVKTRLYMFFKRLLSSKNKRKVKRYTGLFLGRQRKNDGNGKSMQSVDSIVLKKGDTVRVKSVEQIQETLDSWNELKGCQFMDAMKEYCGTTQRVFQTIERFVDERDYRVKKAKGIVILEKLFCYGTPKYGRCDRACFYFWRNEWLEKIQS